MAVAAVRSFRKARICLAMLENWVDLRTRPPTEAAYFKALETDPNVVLRLCPTPCTTVIMITEIDAANKIIDRIADIQRSWCDGAPHKLAALLQRLGMQCLPTVAQMQVMRR